MANNMIDDMSQKLKEIDSKVKEENMVLAAANLSVTCLIETNKEERLAMQEAHERDIKRWKQVVIAITVGFVALLGATWSGILFTYL